MRESSISLADNSTYRIALGRREVSYSRSFELTMPGHTSRMRRMKRHAHAHSSKVSSNSCPTICQSCDDVLLWVLTPHHDLAVSHLSLQELFKFKHLLLPVTHVTVGLETHSIVFTNCLIAVTSNLLLHISSQLISSTLPVFSCILLYSPVFSCILLCSYCTSQFLTIQIVR